MRIRGTNDSTDNDFRLGLGFDRAKAQGEVRIKRITIGKSRRSDTRTCDMPTFVTLNATAFTEEIRLRDIFLGQRVCLVLCVKYILGIILFLYSVSLFFFLLGRSMISLGSCFFYDSNEVYLIYNLGRKEFLG